MSMCIYIYIYIYYVYMSYYIKGRLTRFGVRRQAAAAQPCTAQAA